MTTQRKTQASDYLTIQGAADALGVSRRHVWTLVKNGLLSAAENPLDRRSKVIKRSDIEKLAAFASLKRQSPMVTETAMAAVTPTGTNPPDASGSTQDARPRAGIAFEPSVQSREIDTYLAERWRDDLPARHTATGRRE